MICNLSIHTPHRISTVPTRTTEQDDINASVSISQSVTRHAESAYKPWQTRLRRVALRLSPTTRSFCFSQIQTLSSSLDFACPESHSGAIVSIQFAVTCLSAVRFNHPKTSDLIKATVFSELGRSAPILVP